MLRLNSSPLLLPGDCRKQQQSQQQQSQQQKGQHQQGGLVVQLRLQLLGPIWHDVKAGHRPDTAAWVPEAAPTPGKAWSDTLHMPGA
jgi:hypothetical protein